MARADKAVTHKVEFWVHSHGHGDDRQIVQLWAGCRPPTHSQIAKVGKQHGSVVLTDYVVFRRAGKRWLRCETRA
jgi:hypothetical protein